jgi:hypothetical protein
MMTETQPPQLTETVRVRDQAHLLLCHLEASRRMSQRRCIDSGQRDPIATVTGRSAVEAAIATTRQMIACMDDLLEELHLHATALEPAGSREPVLVEVGSVP